MAAAAVGLLSLVGTFIMDVQYGWANLLLNAFWFTAISLTPFFADLFFRGQKAPASQPVSLRDAPDRQTRENERVGCNQSHI